MKVERNAPTRGPSRVGAAAYARRVEAADTVDAVDAVLPTTILGIPEAEFTPRVRDAIMGLMGEVDNLRRELTQTRVRLEEAEKSADQDQLLPLQNRRAFVRELTRYIAFTGRYNTPASLIYFYMNLLKKINDTYGHAAGDAVLRAIGPACKRGLRASDLLGRYGGEEFVLLLPGTTLKQAHPVLERVRQEVAAMDIAELRGARVTASIGVAELIPEDVDIHDLLGRADSALYRAKELGRNRIELAA